MSYSKWKEFVLDSLSPAESRSQSRFV